MAIRTPLRDQTAALQAENVTLKAKVATLEGAVATGGTLPRLTGGAVGLIRRTGATYTTMTTSDQQAGPYAVLGTDDRVYGPGRLAPMVGKGLTGNTRYRLKTATGGALNLEPDSDPRPAVSTAYTYLYAGITTPDGSALQVADYLIPLYEPRPAISTLSGTLAQYDFKQGADPALVYDVSGNGKHLTLGGSYTWEAGGLRTTSSTTMTNATLTFPATSMTMLAAFNMAAAPSPNSATLLARNGSSGPRWQLSTGRVQQVITNTNLGSTALVGTALALNTQHRLLTEWDATTMRGFDASATQVWTSTFASGLQAGGEVVFGRVPNSTEPFVGLLQYVYLLSRVLPGADKTAAFAEINSSLTGR